MTEKSIDFKSVLFVYILEHLRPHVDIRIIILISYLFRQILRSHKDLHTRQKLYLRNLAAAQALVSKYIGMGHSPGRYRRMEKKNLLLLTR